MITLDKLNGLLKAHERAVKELADADALGARIQADEGALIGECNLSSKQDMEKISMIRTQRAAIDLKRPILEKRIEACLAEITAEVRGLMPGFNAEVRQTGERVQAEIKAALSPFFKGDDAALNLFVERECATVPAAHELIVLEATIVFDRKPLDEALDFVRKAERLQEITGAK